MLSFSFRGGKEVEAGSAIENGRWRKSQAELTRRMGQEREEDLQEDKRKGR